ncbi:MAG: DUF938 domain-containing protein [Gammaproteobacteria bacterium]|nr:DUF938 domain-containing protein [Gammaproteobacteria bacterium]
MSVPTDPRRDAPAFHRNVAPIREVLLEFLGGRGGDVLEIGAGTGQHAVAFSAALPELRWWPTDAGATQLDSIDAWRLHDGGSNLQAPFTLDAAASDWHLQSHGLAAELTAIISLNVVHISPWRVSEGLFAGAGRSLAADGLLILYGPFSRDGAHTAASNAAFDADLRRRDPDWGIRDTADLQALASAHGLELNRIEPMPANNFTLVFARKQENSDRDAVQRR